MQNPLALVADPDWTMRELMRRTLAGTGFTVLESASSLQLDVALRTRASGEVSSILVVASSAIVLACRELIVSLGRGRASEGLSAPQVLLTCEFGTLKSCVQPALPECKVVGLLEKPFDFSLLEAIAYRCRTAPGPGKQHAGSLR